MVLRAVIKIVIRYIISNRVHKVYSRNQNVKNSKTRTVFVVNKDYLKHLTSAKQQAKISSEEAGSKTNILKI